MAYDSNIDENEEALIESPCNDEELIKNSTMELKKLSPLNVLETVDFFQTWFADNNVEGLYFFDLKDMIVNEELSDELKLQILLRI